MVFIYLLIALLAAAAVAFAVQNPEPVRLSFLSWKTTSMPLSFLLLMAAFIGVVVASVSWFAEKFQLQRRVRALERQLAALSAESWPPTMLREPVHEPRREPIRDPMREPIREPMRERFTPAPPAYVPPAEPAREPVPQSTGTRTTATRAEVRPPI
jgi:uncharacterized integral membrane protein